MMSQCKKFAPNIFHKTKCTNCFRQKEEHSAEALECNRASRSIARSGYLFVAPDWDFSVPLNRTKRWQRRWFVLYDDGELNYSVDEHPDTIPQGSVDMSKVLEVTGAEQVTGHPHSLALTSPDRVTFVKAASREDARWWAELLAVFPRRHKRNATFPGGRASPSLPQLGRSASPQPPRPRHLSCTGPSPRTNFETPPLKEEKETSPAKEEHTEQHYDQLMKIARPGWLPVPTTNVTIDTSNLTRKDYLISSGSPPTRDKLRCDEKARTRRDWRNERLRDIATALTDRSPEPSLALPAESLLHLKKGWLWLKAADGDLVRRWIVLSGPTLKIYQEQDEQATPEIVVELSTVISYNEIPTDLKYGFEIKWAGEPLILSAVTNSIRSNWLQALKKAAPVDNNNPVIITPPTSTTTTPTTPLRSAFLSSDEEYRTASEGGRRGSEDWGDLPPSPPLNRLNRTKLRNRLPRSQSRQSTLDSTSTDELDCVKPPSLDMDKQYSKALEEIRTLEDEIARLKKFQADAVIQEKKAKEMIANLEQIEREQNQRNTQIEMKFLKEQRLLQNRLNESEESQQLFEEKYNCLLNELQSKQRNLYNLQEELANVNERLVLSHEDNNRLYKKLQELELKCHGNNNNKKSHLSVDSLNDLTNIDLELDIEELGQNELKEYCLDLRQRFEKAVLEIRAVKRKLREAYEKNDNLELNNYSLLGNIEVIKQESQSEINLLSVRLEQLTNKLAASEKLLKSKTKTETKDKRRSLSLKGRENFSINKEVEDKVTELEAKIIALEKGKVKKRSKREKSSDRSSPADDKVARRLRRKSLDSATSSESMKLLMRLSSLESQVTNCNNVSTESLNVDSDITTAKTKVNECLYQINSLKSSLSKRSQSYDRLLLVEQYLTDISEVLDNNEEIGVINTSVNSTIKQLQNILIDKLSSLAEKKRILRENNKLDNSAKLQLLAEKFAYENILINRIQDALLSVPSDDALCERLIKKEMKETSNLIIGLQNKLSGKNEEVSCKTGVDALSKTLAKCLISTSQNQNSTYRNLIALPSSDLSTLQKEQKKLNILLNSYKVAKLPQLAEALATETISMATDKTCRLQINENTVKDFMRSTADIVNFELIQSEINHVLFRAAQIYQANFDDDNNAFFSFFAAERAALELWSDSVNDCLYIEINKTIDELTELYKNHLNKLQQQNWRKRVESERHIRSPSSMLNEFADIIAHKALIDARIKVLCGKHEQSAFSSDCKQLNLSDLLENEQNWNDLDSVQIDQSLEVEFKLMLDRSLKDCYALIGQPELEEVLGYLNDIAEEIGELQKQATQVPVRFDNDIVVKNWKDVCTKCKSLRDKLQTIRRNLESTSRRRDGHTVYLGTEYLNELENLRLSYRNALASCKEHHHEAEIEQLRMLCERVLVAMEQWHLRTIQELREQHSIEMQQLKEEKEQALAEETQATLAALDAMRKAHEAEVQREVAKFKQEYARKQRDDILDLSERLSVKCLEAAALEEQLGSATRQLNNAQQHILKLERNPQLSTMQN